MSYNDFLNILLSPIQYFLNWLVITADSLIHNYFFITILGITLFISLVWLLYNAFDFLIYSHINDYDDYENKMYDYKLYKEVQNAYNDSLNYNKNKVSNKYINPDIFLNNYGIYYDENLKKYIKSDGGVF